MRKDIGSAVTTWVTSGYSFAFMVPSGKKVDLKCDVFYMHLLFSLQKEMEIFSAC